MVAPYGQMKSPFLRFTVPVLAIVACCVACVSVKNPPFEQTAALVNAIAQYKLPTQSVPAPTTEKGALVGAVSALYEIAVAQGLIADGRLAAQGIFIAGRQGKNGQMLVAVKIYQNEGRWAFTHVTSAKYFDHSACEEMSKKLLSAISADDGKH